MFEKTVQSVLRRVLVLLPAVVLAPALALGGCSGSEAESTADGTQHMENASGSSGSVTPAPTTNYSCVATFDAEARVEVTPFAVGGKLEIKMLPDLQSLASLTVDSLESVSRDETGEAEGFAATMGYLAGPGVSNLTPAELAKVTRLDAITATNAGDAEVMVYRLFEGDTQIGGFVVLGGARAASCMPSAAAK